MLRRTLLTTLLALAVVPASSVPAFGDAPAVPQGISADDAADRVQAFYDRTATYRAKFKQRYIVKAHGKTLDSAGEVVFQKPGKMSWRYTSNGNRVVSDGKIVKVYEKSNRQMFQQPMDKTQYPAALAFLTGTGRLKDAFNFTLGNASQMGFEGGLVLIGVPRTPTPAYQKVFFYVDMATFEVRRALILDIQGNKNRFDFIKPEVNKAPPPGEFLFVPPAGTQVITP